MEKLLEILNRLHPDVDFENTDSLVSDEILDSLDISIIVGDIFNELQIAIPASEIIPENFDSVEAIMALLVRLDEE